jgi:Xaa-Pro dipeptidase
MSPSRVVPRQGGKEQRKYDTDGEHIFRQEARACAAPALRRHACAMHALTLAAFHPHQSFFQWAFGVAEPGCYGVLNLRSGAATLLVPRQPPEYAVWMGDIRSPDWFRDRYGVDAAGYANQLSVTLAPLAPAWLHVLEGTNSDSGEAFAPTDLPSLGPSLEFCFEDGAFGLLHAVMTRLRAHKTDAELAVMRYASAVTSDAHVAAMRAAAPGLREYHLETAFLHSVNRAGCRHAAYVPIAAAGRHGAALHYGHAGAPNDGPLRAGDLALCDFGAEYHCYAADVTTCVCARADVASCFASVAHARTRSLRSQHLSHQRPLLAAAGGRVRRRAGRAARRAGGCAPGRRLAGDARAGRALHPLRPARCGDSHR